MRHGCRAVQSGWSASFLVLKVLTIAVVASAALIAASIPSSSATITPFPLAATWQLRHSIVSVAKIGRRRFVFADYRQLYYWREGADPVIPTVTLRDGLKINTTWNPTGIYAQGGDVYIANYNGRDVLVGRLSSDGRKLTIHAEIRDPKMVSPENVFVNKNYIAVADYDASGIFLFDKRGKLLWRRLGLSLAHGVTIADGFVYVTCLGNQKLLKLDLHGNIVAQNNASSWDDLLYPTSIQPTAGTSLGGKVAVIDANRGKIVVYDDDLRKVREFGGNAPDMFKRPYGFVIADGRILVADTSNRRLMWLSMAGKLEGPAFEFEPLHNIGIAPRWGHEYTYCSYDETALVAGFESYRFYTGFATLCLFRDGVLKRQLLLPYSRLDGTGLRERPVNGFTFAWHASVKRDGIGYDVIGSFDRSIYMVQQGAGYVFVDGPAEVSIWGAVGAETVLLEIVRRAQSKFADQRQVSRRCSELFDFFFQAGFVKASPEQALLAAILNPAIKEVARAWLKGGSVELQPDDLPTGQSVSLDDLTMLSLIKRSSVDRERMVWQRCLPLYEHRTP
jgi:hypothetical protein